MEVLRIIFDFGTYSTSDSIYLIGRKSEFNLLFILTQKYTYNIYVF